MDHGELSFFLSFLPAFGENSNFQMTFTAQKPPLFDVYHVSAQVQHPTAYPFALHLVTRNGKDNDKASKLRV